jgi:hypothetical protein
MQDLLNRIAELSEQLEAYKRLAYILNEEGGHNTPSLVMEQPWSFIMVRKQNFTAEEIAMANKWIEEYEARKMA